MIFQYEAQREILGNNKILATKAAAKVAKELTNEDQIAVLKRLEPILSGPAYRAVFYVWGKKTILQRRG